MRAWLNTLRIFAFAQLLLPLLAFAHSPFDSSTRAILHGDSVELMVTAGSDLASNFLATVGVNAANLNHAGHPTTIPVAVAAQLFDVNADAASLAPTAAKILTDGLEFQFYLVYPLAANTNLSFAVKFLGQLKPPHVSALVITDDNGNVLASSLLKRGNEGVEFALPKNISAPPLNQTAAARALPNAVASESLSAAATPRLRPSFWEMFKLGLEHILTGYDHLLFLFALLLGCRRLKPMLWVVTGFTVAHSITLALAALNLANLSPGIVEPLIAASIAIVAVENFRRAGAHWSRYALTCGFGLIHGFGFASALRDTGLAHGGAELARDLFAFNLGVETGQLAVAAVVVPILFLLRRWNWFARCGTKWLSAVVILVAGYWFLQRVFPAWF
jgi:hydrogenase/urease accessory protein HupE